MMDAWAGIAIMALLFTMFGFVRHRAGCGGNCGACSGACERRESSDDNA